MDRIMDIEYEKSELTSSAKGNKRKRVILTIEHKLEICRNLKQARTFTKAIKHVKFFFTKTN